MEADIVLVLILVITALLFALMVVHPGVGFVLSWIIAILGIILAVKVRQYILVPYLNGTAPKSNHTDHTA